MAILEFNTQGKEEMDDFGTLPSGEYNVHIIKSELKPTKDNRGQRLNFSFKVLDGDFKGRILFTGLNVKNDSPMTVEISMKQLTSIIKACGKVSIKDSQELHSIPLKVTVKIKPKEGVYSEKNEIIKYERYSSETFKEDIPDFVQESENVVPITEDVKESTEESEGEPDQYPWEM